MNHRSEPATIDVGEIGLNLLGIWPYSTVFLGYFKPIKIISQIVPGPKSVIKIDQMLT